MKAHHDQHFLTDPHAVDRIADLAEVKGKHVLEVGPGNGVSPVPCSIAGLSFTRWNLMGVSARSSSNRFSEEISTGQLTVQHGDAIRCELPLFEMVVSNLPYSVSSKITFRLLDIGFTEAVLMYQSEFAERMVAPAGTKDCGRLSIMVQTYAVVQKCFKLPPNCFTPKPQVHSTVVKIVPRSSLSFPSMTGTGMLMWSGHSSLTVEKRFATA